MGTIFISFIITTIIIWFIWYLIKPDTYDVVYKPISKRYYPRVNGYYIYRWNSGKYTLESSPEGCEHSHYLEASKEILDKYKEYQGVHDKIIKL